MPTRFERAHQEQLQGTLTTVDRLIIHGHLQRLWFPHHMAYFLDRLGVHISRGFGEFVKGASDRVKAHAEAIARKAGRPFLYQDRVVHGKDDVARQIAARDGITEGLICVLSTVEVATCFALAGGAIRPRLRKCLHLYFYVLDRELGLIHIRLQTWFPFQIQIYINGREWLARQLERRGVGFERYQNTFLSIEDLPLAQRLCASFTQRRWTRLFDAFARRVNPWLPVIRKLDFGSYYWCILWRYVQIGEATNRRYLDALAEVKPTGHSLAQLDSLCRPRVLAGQHFARFNPVCRADSDFFAAVLSGAHLINGLHNGDIQQKLWPAPSRDPAEARRRCRRVSRLIAKLRGHGLLAKVPGRRRYRVTLLGRRLMAAAIHYRRRDFPDACAA